MTLLLAMFEVLVEIHYTYLDNKFLSCMKQKSNQTLAVFAFTELYPSLSLVSPKR